MISGNYGPKKRGGLRHWIIMVVGRSPKNGAEIMDTIEEMNLGWWRPSPGSVYPMLNEMVQSGTLSKRDDGRYEITEKAKAEIDWSFGFTRRKVSTPEEVLREFDSLVSYLEDMKSAKKVELAMFKEQLESIIDRIHAVME
jgi:DNA-binding PadR family transcriptional regulator